MLQGIEPFEIIYVERVEPKQSPLHMMNKKDTEFVAKKIDESLAFSVIVESQSPWRHNVVFVPKKDDSSRITINYKPLNGNTIFDAYPFPIFQFF